MSGDGSLVDSYYEASAGRKPVGSALDGGADVDVCVIGGGFTGVSAALNLVERGHSVAVLEARKIGWGASGRSGGQVLPGYSCHDVKGPARKIPKATARGLWDLSVEATGIVRERIARHGIDCDLQDGCMLAACKDRQAAELRSYQKELAEDYGYDIEFLDRDRFRGLLASDCYVCGAHDPQGAHIHPLKYVLGLAQAAVKAGVAIHEDTRAVSYSGGADPRVVTAKGEVRCKRVVLACNAYIDGLEPRISPKVMPVGTYICATRQLGKERAESLIANRASVCDMNFVLDYYRLSRDDRMLFGGRVSYSTIEPANIAAAMRRRMVRVFPQLASEDIDYVWGGYVAITASRFPDFGWIDGNVIYAQGFSGHGMALTGLAGKLIAEAIDGDAERFDSIAGYRHKAFPGGPLMRTPLLVLGMLWHRMRDWL